MALVKNPVNGPLLRWKLLDPHPQSHMYSREWIICAVFKTFYQNISRTRHKNNLATPKELVILGTLVGRKDTR